MSTPGAPVLEDLQVTYPAGTYVFRQGEAGSEMFIIQEGRVEILAQKGRKEVPLAVLEEGDFFGEMAVLEDLPRTASARTLTPCQLLRIDRQTFDQLIRHNPEIAVRMLRKLCHRLRTAQPQPLEAPATVPEPPAPAETLSASAAALVHVASDTRFVLSTETENSVGRKDPVTGLAPTVDLSAVDPQKTTSRRHATLFLRDGKWFVREEVGVRNGTFVNDQRLTPGEERTVSHGDRLRFGLVELEFHSL